MECRYIQSRLASHVDGDLSPGGRREVERHVAVCAECREELVALQRFTDDCREFLVFPGPAYSFDALRARMKAIEPLEEIAAFLPRLRVMGTVPRFAVTLLLMILIGGTPFTIRNTRMLYVAMKTPFTRHMDKIDEAYREYLPQQVLESEDGGGDPANPAVFHRA